MITRGMAWVRRRIWWKDLSRDWRLAKPATFPCDIKSNWSPSGTLILRRNTSRPRRLKGVRRVAARGITLPYRHRGARYALKLKATQCRELTDPKDWVVQFPARTVPVTDIVCRVQRSGREPSITVVLTTDFAATRATNLSPDGVASAPFDRTQPSPDDVRAMHHEVAAAWRQLTDVRFKLLALLPVISGIGLFSLLDDDGSIASSPGWARATAAAFGFVITVGLYVYDRRNSQLYDDLISRGKHLEDAMGFTSGVFRGRLHSTSPINHGTALRVIYLATLLAWLAVFVAIVSGQLDHATSADPPDG